MADGAAPCSGQRIYDLRLVRASEAPAGQHNHIQYSAYRSDTYLMGDSLDRVYVSGACQQVRFCRQRWAFHTHAAKSDAGGYHFGSVHCLHSGFLPSGDTPLESLRRIRMPYSRRLLRLHEIGWE